MKYLAGLETRLPSQLLHFTFFFLPTFSPNLTQTWNFDADLVITSFFLRRLFGRYFSPFLALLDIIAVLLKKV